MPTEGVGPERERDWAEAKAEDLIPFSYDYFRPDVADALRQARRDGAEEEFERLYGVVVGRIQADIAGDFEAGLNQLEYNAREKGRRDGAIAALEKMARRRCRDCVIQPPQLIAAEWRHPEHEVMSFAWGTFCEAGDEWEEIARLKAGGEV